MRQTCWALNINFLSNVELFSLPVIVNIMKSQSSQLNSLLRACKVKKKNTNSLVGMQSGRTMIFQEHTTIRNTNCKLHVVFHIGSCNDESKECTGYKDLGYCAPAHSFHECMKTTCPKTCGFCQGMESSLISRIKIKSNLSQE